MTTAGVNVEGDAQFNVNAPQESEESGARQGRNIPGSEEFYTSGGGGGNIYNAAAQTILFPADDPGSYFPRAIITQDELVDHIEMTARTMRMYTGYENPIFTNWLYLAGTLAIGGRARLDFVHVASGARQIENEAKSGRGVGSRLAELSNQNNRLNQNQ